MFFWDQILTMKTILATACLILCTFSSCCAKGVYGTRTKLVCDETTQPKHSPEEYFCKGERKLNEKQYLEAQQYFSLIQRHFPKHPLCERAHLYAKLCAMELDQAQLPSSTLTRYVPSNPSDSYSKPLEPVYVLSHPLIQHKASLLRNKKTNSKVFRECLKEVSLGICYEATRDLALKNVSIQTPLMQAECPHLTGPKIVVVPVLRAGLGMVDGFLSLVPTAKVGVIGMSRDHETFQASAYCCKLPEDISDCLVFIVDPMLATGGSASATIQLVKEHGAKNITLLNVLAVPEGIERIQKDHPDVTVYVASLDEKLNDVAYILPGLGDAGDRFCGTSNPS